MSIALKTAESPYVVKAFDTLSHVGLPQAQALSKLGFSVALLYANTATLDDIENCAASGLGIAFILEGLAASTQPSNALGASNATGALNRLAWMGIPKGFSLMIDLEGNGHEAADWIAYATGASQAASAAGAKPGYYVGEGIGLTSAELYALPGFPYWKGLSRVVDRHGMLAEPVCGWAVVQSYPDDLIVGGTQVDVDIVGKDYRGRTLTVVTAA